MKSTPLTRAEQAAERIKQLAAAGALGPELPGVELLAAECGVSPETMRAGLKLLEREGLVRSGGPGRPRVLVAAGAAAGRVFSFAVLARDRLEWLDADFRTLLEVLQAEVTALGHRFLILPQAQRELGHDWARIRKKVESQAADAWLVDTGTREMLEWFAGRGQPVMAMGGTTRDIPGIAAVSSSLLPAVGAAMEHLVGLGHRRIVVLCEATVRNGLAARTSLFKVLQGAGTMPGSYNMPDWDETPDGLQNLLESLFRVTPPTALIVFQPSWMNGVLAFLARRGLKCPEDVSLICGGREPGLDWWRPKMAHFRHAEQRALELLLRWVKSVVRGNPITGRQLLDVEFVEGGTVGPPSGKP